MSLVAYFLTKGSSYHIPVDIIERLPTLSSSEAPTGYPSENRNKRAGDSGKREKVGASIRFLSAQHPPAGFLFSLSPTSLRQKEDSAEVRGFVNHLQEG